MSVVDENEGFTLTANVLTPGYVSIIPKGYVVSRRRDGVYQAGFLPDMFLGYDGKQLDTWRQYVPAIGNQVVLTKPAGHLLVPKQDLFWTKVSDVDDIGLAGQGIVMAEPSVQRTPLPSITVEVGLGVPILVGGLAYVLSKKRRLRNSIIAGLSALGVTVTYGYIVRLQNQVQPPPIIPPVT